MSWNVKDMDELVSTQVSVRRAFPSSEQRYAAKARGITAQSLVTFRSRSVSVKLGHGEGNVKLRKMRLDPEA